MGIVQQVFAQKTLKLYCAKDSTISSLAVEGDYLTWNVQPGAKWNVVQNDDTALLAIRSYTEKSIKDGTEAMTVDVIFVDVKVGVLQDMILSKHFQYEKPFEANCRR